MTIEELMFYGRYYSFEDAGYHLWWFDSYSGSIYEFYELINKLGYFSQEDIISSERFIPLFETDIVKLEQDFLRAYNYEVKQLENAVDMDFDTKFKIFVEKNNLTELWKKFESCRLYHDAIVWCNDNFIKKTMIIR